VKISTKVMRKQGSKRERQRMRRIYYSLYDRLLRPEALADAFMKVKSAKGAAGIDRQSLKDFEENLVDELQILLKELREKGYRPKPVERVIIPKPDGGKRMLGIPSVRDRVVQQALLDILQPIYEEDFHPSSYGYRPGRSCHQAITKATMFMRKYGLKWVVDMDLSKCFDRLDHELIMKGIRKRVTDGSILNLIKMFLKSGVATEKGIEATKIGSPQGGVISPLLANVYLNAFDQFMMHRGHRIVRYADDILILCRSRKGAENARKVAETFLEGPLKLTVNKEKTHLTHTREGVKFLGVEIGTTKTHIQEKKVKNLKKTIKELTRRTGCGNLAQTIACLNPILRGFGNYFRIANCKGVFVRMMRWIRRRLRAKQLALWKKPDRLHRRLRQLGYRGEFMKINMKSWRNAASPQASMALPNGYFDKLKLFDLTQLETGILVRVPTC